MGRYEIVPGDPREHRDAFLGLCFRNLPASRETSERRYRKYYESNPAGPASFFLARPTGEQDFCGVVASFPAPLWVDGEVVPAVVNGDLAVDEAHRALGPALTLERTLLASIGENGSTCAYGRPNPQAEVIVERTGFVDLGRVTQFVKVLKTRPFAKAYVERPAVRPAVSAASFALDPLLSLVSRERFQRRPRDLSVERPERFDERFSAVWDAARREHRVTSVRGAGLLNWKYELEVDGGGFSIFALARPDGEIAAYLVYEVKDGVRHVYDLLFGGSEKVLDTLLAEFVRDSRRARAAAVSLVHRGAAGPLTRRLRAFGFLRRTKEDGLRVLVDADAPYADSVLDGEAWYLLAGDNDV